MHARVALFDALAPCFGPHAGWEEIADAPVPQPINWGASAAMRIRLCDYLMSGEHLYAEEAERIGMISMCVDDDKLQETALKVAVNLTKASPSAIRWTKLSMNNWLLMAWPIFENSLPLEILGFSGPDVVEGLKAYDENRQPVFNPASPV